MSHDPIASQELPAGGRRCPACDYILVPPIGKCPECGLHVTPDMPAIISPFDRRFPFSFIAASWMAMRRPARLVRLAPDPAALGVTRACIFAALWMVLLVGLWPIIMRTGIFTIGIARYSLSACMPMIQQTLVRFHSPMTWLRAWRWPAWNTLRWWLLLTVIALCAGRRAGFRGRAPSAGGAPAGRYGTPLVLSRLALLAPWIALTDLLFLIGVWIDEPPTVPEPHTMFHNAAWQWDYCVLRVWLIRAWTPSFMLGYVFFRHALGLRAKAALFWAALFMPVAVNWSIFWSMLYMWLF